MRWLQLFNGPAGAVVETLFPATCWAKGGSAAAKNGLSEQAMMEIAMLAAQNYCRHCGLTTGLYASNDFRNPCARCGQRQCAVRRVARVGTFSEPLVALIHRLKFGRSWEVARVLAPFLQHAILQVAEEAGVTVDALVPVPLHWLRRARRGFNQAEELAREAARLGGWPVRKALRRVRRTAQQTRIESPTRRAENLQAAFCCTPDERLAGKHVWIVDDVSTTGATIHAAATAFRKLPAKFRPASLNAAVVCVTDHGAPPAQVEVFGDD